MKQTCSKCGVQMYDPFFGTIKMHNEETCCGVVRTGFVMTEPIPDINEAKITYTKTDKIQDVSLPKKEKVYNEVV